MALRDRVAAFAALLDTTPDGVPAAGSADDQPGKLGQHVATALRAIKAFGPEIDELRARTLETFFAGRVYTQAEYDGLTTKPTTYAIAPALATFGVGTVTSQATPGNQNLNTFNHTVPAGTGRLLVAVAAGSASQDTSLDPGISATYGGESMTEVPSTRIRSTGGTSSGHDRAVRWFTMVNPPAGTAEVRVNINTLPSTSGPPSHAAAAVNVGGGSALGTPATSATTTTDSTLRSVTTTSATGGYVLAVASARDTVAPSPDAGAQTVLARLVAGTNTALLLTQQPSGSGVTSTSRMTTAGQHALAALPVLPA